MLFRIDIEYLNHIRECPLQTVSNFKLKCPQCKNLLCHGHLSPINDLDVGLNSII